MLHPNSLFLSFFFFWFKFYLDRFPSQLLEQPLQQWNMRMIEGYFIMLLCGSVGKKWVTIQIHWEDRTGYASNECLVFLWLILYWPYHKFFTGFESWNGRRNGHRLDISIIWSMHMFLTGFGSWNGRRHGNRCGYATQRGVTLNK